MTIFPAFPQNLSSRPRLILLQPNLLRTSILGRYNWGLIQKRGKDIVDVDQFKVVPMRIQRGLAWSGEVEIYFENFARIEKQNVYTSQQIYKHCNHQFMQLNNKSKRICVPKRTCFTILIMIGQLLIICLQIEEANILALRLYCQPSCYRRWVILVGKPSSVNTGDFFSYWPNGQL